MWGFVLVRASLPAGPGWATSTGSTSEHGKGGSVYLVPHSQLSQEGQAPQRDRVPLPLFSPRARQSGFHLLRLRLKVTLHPAMRVSSHASSRLFHLGRHISTRRLTTPSLDLTEALQEAVAIRMTWRSPVDNSQLMPKPSTMPGHGVSLGRVNRSSLSLDPYSDPPAPHRCSGLYSVPGRQVPLPTQRRQLSQDFWARRAGLYHPLSD